MNVMQVIKKAHEEGTVLICIARKYQRVIRDVYVSDDLSYANIATHCGKYYNISNKAKAVFSEDYSEVTLQGRGSDKVTLIFLRNDTEAYHTALGLTLLD